MRPTKSELCEALDYRAQLQRKVDEQLRAATKTKIELDRLEAFLSAYIRFDGDNISILG